MMESEVMGNYHASFGERDGETRTVRIVKVRTVPTPLSPLLANIALHGLETHICTRFPARTKRNPAQPGRQLHWQPQVIRYADGTPVQA
jgi:hypothetical protein